MTSSNDHQLARDLAVQAGELLLALRPGLLAALEPKAAGEAADAAAQDLLAQMLLDFRPDDSVLSEEALDDAVRLSAARVWIIDPLDGTREYVSPEREDWAVHVALWARDGSGPVAAVALPAQGITLSTDEPPVLPPRPASVDDSSPGLRLVMSRSRPPALLAPLTEVLAAQGVRLELRPHGSAGAKAAEVVLGRADAYLHDAGLNQWDAAAPVMVATAAGLHTSHLDGSPLVFNGASAVTGDLLICRPELADTLLAALRDV